MHTFLFSINYTEFFTKWYVKPFIPLNFNRILTISRLGLELVRKFIKIVSTLVRNRKIRKECESFDQKFNGTYFFYSDTRSFFSVEVLVKICRI